MLETGLRSLCIISFNSQNNPMRQVFLIPTVQTQKNHVTRPRSYWQSCWPCPPGTATGLLLGVMDPPPMPDLSHSICHCAPGLENNASSLPLESSHESLWLPAAKCALYGGIHCEGSLDNGFECNVQNPFHPSMASFVSLSMSWSTAIKRCRK